MNTPPDPLRRVLVQGFKSIESCNLELTRLNVIIGSNGAGKSNFISLFRMMQAAVDGKFQYFVTKNGGIDAMLRHGRSQTKNIAIRFNWASSTYLAAWEPTADNRMIFAEEECESAVEPHIRAHVGRDQHLESILSQKSGLSHNDEFDRIAIDMAERIRGWRVYHFHDTSETATVKRINNIDDHAYLRPDAENLAAFLRRLRIQYRAHYDWIVKAIRLAAPFFDDFVLEPEIENPNIIQLRWREIGRDAPFKAFQLSDGTLRFICLATLLLQPDDVMPSIILLDEPELGLHPTAIEHLAGMLRSVSAQRQIIVTTQSVELLNRCEAGSVIVADRDQQGATTFTRLDQQRLEAWLVDYSLGQLWMANHLGGKPA
jgi:predicted ATPase